MTTHYALVSADFPVIDAVNGQPAFEQVVSHAGEVTGVKPMVGSWGLVVRMVLNDPRVLAGLDDDTFALNDLRMKLTRKADRVNPVQPGDVVEFSAKEKTAMATSLQKSKIVPSILSSGAIEMLRALYDAPTTDPRVTEKRANGTAKVAAAAP